MMILKKKSPIYNSRNAIASYRQCATLNLPYENLVGDPFLNPFYFINERGGEDAIIIRLEKQRSLSQIGLVRAIEIVSASILLTEIKKGLLYYVVLIHGLN